jgi:hypothetical protein
MELDKEYLDKLEVEIIIKYDGKVIDVDITDTSYDYVYQDVDMHFENQK